MKRRTFLQTTAATTTAISTGSFASGSIQAQTEQKLVIGYPTAFGFLSTLRSRSEQIAGVNIEWQSFGNTGPMIEAHNSGAIDLTENGDSLAITLFSNGADFKVIATTESQPKAAGLIVQKDLAARSFPDLVGKKIIFLQGTNLHVLFLNLLKKYNLNSKDFVHVNLGGPDARSAFAAGAGDAIMTVDPALASVEVTTGGRLLLDGSNGLVENPYVYTATGKALREKEAALRLVVPKLREAITWAALNREQQADYLFTSKILPFPKEAILRGYGRSAKKLVSITPELLSAEQKIADVLFEAGIAKKPVDVNQLYDLRFNKQVTG
ncbi:MAG: ABC transporter substrate-binding protein [Cyanobacteriota bacterium]|nr:ABC transporter substrate-binding protein [Cyanobacteriota bacterium]